MLNQFFKRLLRNEGIIEEQDDIFRHIYTSQRIKISRVLTSRPEVRGAIESLINENIEKVGTDKVGSLFSFIVKSSFPVDNELLKKITKGFKKKIITEISAAIALRDKRPAEE
jgi:hypothetical protein